MGWGGCRIGVERWGGEQGCRKEWRGGVGNRGVG